MDQPATHCYQFDCFSLNTAKRLLSRDGKAVPLQAKDFELLLALVKRSGQVVSKEELLKQVWQDSYVEEGILASTFSRKLLKNAE